MGEWISVDEMMPNDWQYVVAADIGDGCIYSAFVCHYSSGCFNPDTGGLQASNYDGGAVIYADSNTPITHWMPLPEPPKDGQ